MMEREGPEHEVERVIVFDLDDTLYLERDYVKSGFRAVGQWIEEHYSLPNFAQALAYHFDAGRREHVFDSALCDFGVRPATSLISQLIEIYRAHAPQITLAADAAAFLANPGKGNAFALVTDGHLVAQRAKIQALELERWGFWPLVCTDAWGREYWKPHERSFRLVEAFFALPPQAFIYVADNPLKDFIAPRRLGWRTIQVLRPERVHHAVVVEPHQVADHTVTTLLTIHTLLDRASF